MATFTLQADQRDLATRPKLLQQQGILPAIIYGPKNEPLSVQVPEKAFITFWKTYDRTSIINLAFSGKKQDVLIRHIQKHPVTDQIQNIEFYAIDPDKKMIIEIPVHLTGVAPTVKIEKGILFQNVSTFKAKCLPSAIVPEIIVDISILTTFEKAVFVRDLKLPEGMEPAMPLEELVVKVLRPKLDETAQVAAAASAAAGAAAPDAKKKK